MDAGQLFRDCCTAAVWSCDAQLKSLLDKTDKSHACISFSVSIDEGDWQDLTDTSTMISSAFWPNPSLIPSLIPECSVWLTQVLATRQKKAHMTATASLFDVEPDLQA